MTLSSRQVMSGETESQVIVVASRLPYELIKATTDNGPTDERTSKTPMLKKSVSGLVTAVNEGFEGLPIRLQWMGGLDKHDVEEFRRLEKLEKTSIQQDLRAIPIDREKYDEHRKWSNGQLWPILHGMLTRVDTTAGKDCWESYKKVNEVYAKAIVKRLADLENTNTIVWIHDYHLFLVPKLVSEMASQQNLRCRIGFFLHTTFPPAEKLEKLPNFKEILEGMLGSDSIGFHTRDDDCRNFIDCCQKYMDCKATPVNDSLELRFRGRTIFVIAVPVGIAYPKSERPKAQLPEKLPKDLLHKLEMEPEKIVLLIGVDRIDYTKGLVQKVEAFASQSLQTRLKELHILNQCKFIYLQIAIPCRITEPEYEKLRKEFDKRVDEAKQFLKENEHPSEMHVCYKTFSKEELSVLYNRADVALVTPLIDGLNLVAMEYIAWQDDKPGVLVLSKNAGAAKYLSEDALKVDPYDTMEMANAIHKAICMTPEKRKEAMARLQEQVKGKLDAKNWVKSNLDPLKERTDSKAKL